MSQNDMVLVVSVRNPSVIRQIVAEWQTGQFYPTTLVKKKLGIWNLTISLIVVYGRSDYFETVALFFVAGFPIHITNWM